LKPRRPEFSPRLAFASARGEFVPQFREPDLQSGALGLRALREDVEDEARPVDHRRAHLVLEVVRASRVEFVVHDDDVDVVAFDALGDVGHGALAEVVRRVGGSDLRALADGVEAGGVAEGADFGRVHRGRCYAFRYECCVAAS